MYYLFILGNIVTAILGRRLSYFIARQLAFLQYYFSHKDRRVVIYNLAPIVKDKSKIKKYAKEVFVNFSYYLVDFFRYSKIDKEFIDKYVRIKGIENVNRAAEAGKGIIALTAHLGNYELAGAVTSLLGYKLSAVALPHKDRRVNEFFDSRREMVGINVIPTGTSIRGCFSVLKNKGMLALLGDKDFSGHGIQLELFSRQALIPRGAAFFALRTGAEIIPSFFIRRQEKFYDLIFEEPIKVRGNNLNEEEITKSYARVLERYLKEYPGQWYMFSKYWFPNADGHK
ncbi:MAG: lysophospholipid acyltransferase family protein [Candidatus Omnitrophica bacterium]|nr:lysophospholipid acyltransferase family protein [Candidatus Omnitrophota bacterium]MDD5429372.1 lysophospholipid acyltransferase family protein [Candidatus Omnitrophota bacterium]